MSRPFLLLLFFYFLVSCARLELNTKNCIMPIAPDGKTTEETQDFELVKTFHTPFSPFYPREVELFQVLDDEKIKCNEIRKIEFSFKSDNSDAFLGFIPFCGHKTLLVRGKKVTN